MYDIYDVITLLLIILVIIYWWRTSEQKSFALVNAKAYCKDREIQLLDETLVFKRFRLAKSPVGKRHLCRAYEFDFCLDGEDRHKGEILISGFHLINIIVETGQLEITQY